LELEARGWEPGSGRPLLALRSLFDTHSVRRGDLLSALGRPGEPGFDPDRRLAVLALGPAGLASADRDRLLPELVAELAGGTSGREDDVPLLGAMLAALEAVDNAAAVAEAERAIRAALGRVRMPPPPPDPDDGTWSPTVHGRFTIGRFAIEQTRGQADEVLHDVVLSPYRLRRHAETLQEIRRLLPNHSKNFLRAGEPARAVDWYTARAYACWSCASLPSEAQWEVACRGGNWEYRRTEWYFGSSATTARRWLLTGESSTEHLLLARLPIEGAPRHPLGLIHMHGNVSEWCIDWYAPYNLNLSTDPTGPRFPPPGARRVIRGGSWHAKLRFCRAASRAGYNPAIRGTGVGLRLALPQPGSVVDR
jgi:formylglycine-generating enzyme required for sulfatase activity